MGIASVLSSLSREAGNMGKWKLPKDYRIISPGSDVDTKAWADLLNLDGGFGVWDSKRIRSEILSRMAAPDSASLLFYKDRLVGCSSVECCKKIKGKVGIGMYLFQKRNHRGKRTISTGMNGTPRQGT